MGDKAISVFVSEDERAFIDGQLAVGKYASEEELLPAALVARQRQPLAPRGFGEADDMSPYMFEDVEELRGDHERSAASGESPRQVRDIMDNMKAKLRANGAL